MITPNLEYNNLNNKETFKYDKIVILIDSSGSTNNIILEDTVPFSETFIDTTLLENENENENIVIDKEIKSIIITEQEAIANIMINLANKYSLNNIKLIIASFDSSCNIAVNKILDSSEELYNYSKNINSILQKNFQSTNLTLAISTLLNNTNENLLFILASDGRADCPESTLYTLDKITDDIKLLNKKLNIFTIGAGSIEKSKFGKISSITNTYNSQTQNDEILNTLSINNSAECDKEFLEHISKKATHYGAYSGAYDDYADLINTFNNFMNMK